MNKNGANASAIVSVEELLMICERLQAEDRYLSLKEVCALTGFSRRSIQKAKGLKRYRPFNGSLRFRLSEVHAWMRKHEEIEAQNEDEFIGKIRRIMGGEK